MHDDKCACVTMWLNCVAPVLQHLCDIRGELVVERVSKDVFDPPILKQILDGTARKQVRTSTCYFLKYYSISVYSMCQKI